MSALQRGLLIAAIVLLGVGEMVWGFHTGMLRIEAQVKARRTQQHATAPLPAATAHLFTRNEANAFLAAAKRAEAIKLPLQRCLAYPDPPGSHWSPDAVRAYCQYRLQPLLPFAEAQALIQHGHAAELDQRLAAALKAQQTQPDAIGLLDRIYQQDFDNGSFDIRPTLDAWKRDSPNSAFAWAASGAAYVAAAADARGSDYLSNTPQDSIDAMDNLLAQAKSDLRHAIALDPHVTPAHIEMIHADAMRSSDDVVEDAIKLGLAAAPDDYSIYSMAMWSRQPNWGGSLPAMRQLATQAQVHAGKNPLLKILLSEAPYYEVYRCDCDQDVELAAYPAALDQLGNARHLMDAGGAARGSRHTAVAAIYLSEALRFDPDLADARTQRVDVLVDFDEAAWAADDAGALIAAAPRNGSLYLARALAYEALDDPVHAEADLRATLAIDPNDVTALSQLGNLLVYQTQQWDKGWDVASRLIAVHPENPYGWILRANIQQRQPRAGLADTVEYFEAHFSSDPQLRKIATQMRSALILQTHSGSQVLAAREKSAAPAPR